MAKGSNIVHQYFKKELEGVKILVRVNPVHLTGTEITLHPDGEAEVRELEFDNEIFNDLLEDGFEAASPLEFNLYWAGLA